MWGKPTVLTRQDADSYGIGANTGDAPSCSVSRIGSGLESRSEITNTRRTHGGNIDPVEETIPHGDEAERQEKAIRVPSGDQEGCSHDQSGLLVSCRTWEPSVSITNICCRA